MFHVGVGYCGVEVSATDRSLVQRSPTGCGVCLSMSVRRRPWGDPGPLGALSPRGERKNRILLKELCPTD